MIRDEDLQSAVEAGVITPEQRTALAKQASERRGSRAVLAGRDERFRFLRGFNDVFLSLGVALVAAAFLSQWSPAKDAGIGWLLAGAAVLWAISELLVGRHRAVMPGMVAVIGIGLMVSLAAGHLAWNSLSVDAIKAGKDLNTFWNFPYRVWMSATGAGGLAVVLYYLRFGLPFAWLPMGYCVAQTVATALTYLLGWERSLPLLSAVAFVLGIGLFVLAMRFDSSDPERLTRRSDCGFWLHLAAAPFIVQPVISMLGGRSTTGAALATILVVCLLGAVALIVDRRALLVSSLLYFGLAVGYLITQTTGDAGWQTALTTTLALLGSFVIVMGLGWHRLRGLILWPFAGASWLRNIPPLQPKFSA